jgi:hypothetical protein
MTEIDPRSKDRRSYTRPRLACFDKRSKKTKNKKEKPKAASPLLI